MTTEMYRALPCAARHCASRWREEKEREMGVGGEEKKKEEKDRCRFAG